MNRIIPTVLVVMLLLIGAGSAAGYTTITASEAYNILNPASPSYVADACIIDVRHESNWLAEHAGENVGGAGAFLESPVRKVFNIPSYTYNVLFDKAVERKFNRNNTIIVMCGGGGTSPGNAARLESLNFNHVLNMDHGLSGWKGANLPTNTNAAGVWPGRLPINPLPINILLLGSENQ